MERIFLTWQLGRDYTVALQTNTYLSPHQVLPFLDIITNEAVTEVGRDDTSDDAETIAQNTKMYNKVGRFHKQIDAIIQY
jgi:hypothetical protein